MAQVTYEIVEHDGGWAYKVDGVFSEAFPTHADALAAERRRAPEARTLSPVLSRGLRPAGDRSC